MISLKNRIAKNRTSLPFALGICDVIVLPFIYWLFTGEIASFGWRCVFVGCLMFILGVVLALPGPCMRSIVIDVNKPHCRSTMIAFGEVFNSLGRVLGPIVFVWFAKYDFE